MIGRTLLFFCLFILFFFYKMIMCYLCKNKLFMLKTSCRCLQEFISQEVSELSHIWPISEAHLKEELIEVKANYIHHLDIISFKFWRGVCNCSNISKISGYVVKLWAMFWSIWFYESIFFLMQLGHMDSSEITIKTFSDRKKLVLKVNSPSVPE